MTITLTPDIEAALEAQARQRGTTPEQVALESLRTNFIGISEQFHKAFEPLDDWERLLVSVGVTTGTSLSNEAVSSEGLYEN